MIFQTITHIYVPVTKGNSLVNEQRLPPYNMKNPTLTICFKHMLEHKRGTISPA